MKLEEMTWQEVEAYLGRANGILLPVGSIEQHGPNGLIGTDSICARELAWGAAQNCQSIVAPELSYAPAPFNMGFPGTVSITVDLLCELARQVMLGLASHGFQRIYILNGHGANLAPLAEAATQVQDAEVLIKSWWDFEPVNVLRRKYYGNWEGMHATPSEIAITQHTHGIVHDRDEAKQPPKMLTPDYMKAHSGDRHGPPDEHRAEFPDGRVGSHSGLARPEQGQILYDAAVSAIAEDYRNFVSD